MKLDVGCGSFPSGDVNCDLFINDVGHRTGRLDVKGAILRPRKMKNFVLCDIHYLPFRSETFDEVYSRHVIEHAQNPFRLLSEMQRVSKNRVLIYCPHRLGDKMKGKNPFHVSPLNKKWFFEANRKIGKSIIKIEYSKFFCIPTEIFCIFRIPLEMCVEIRKTFEEKKAILNNEETSLVSLIPQPIEIPS
jgi:ubiquinone/menaquinone biosynthesis C-methylase UbiE